MLTAWHKTFHILVFGSLVLLALGVVIVRKEYRLQFAPEGKPAQKTESIQTSIADIAVDDGEEALGGATPEETFALFLEALKSGDAKLASRYFVASRQDAWQESLQQIKNGGGLEAMHKELTAISATWKREDHGATVSFSAPHAERITFVQNDARHIWSIDEL